MSRIAGSMAANELSLSGPMSLISNRRASGPPSDPLIRWPMIS